MLRLWILPVLGVIAALAFACGDSGDDKPQTVSSIAAAASQTTTSAPNSAPASITASPLATPHPISATRGPGTYADAVYGYSYPVPAGWFVTGSSVGYSVVTSYDPTQATGPGDVPPELLKAEFNVYANGQSLDLETWINQNTTGADVQSESQREIAGQNAIVRAVTLPASGGAAATQYFFEDRNRVFVTVAYTSNETLLSEFDTLLDRFQLNSQ